jgi:coproporphyrinogen III oxidase
MTGLGERAAEIVSSAHEALTRFYAELDGSGTFVEQVWSRKGGGGGVSRLMTDGALFEKVGANRALVHGEFSAEMAEQLLCPTAPPDARFFAAGLSTIAHPLSPKVPTIHLNARYFELVDRRGSLLDHWFGGVVDLTPMHPIPEDAALFHRELERLCAAHGEGLYAAFKPACDSYFSNRHRGGEPRGVGGIFFDHLRPGGLGLDAEGLLNFFADVAAALPRVFAPIVRRRREEPYDEAARRLQLHRRGRYVEFNLLHDRGTAFGVKTGARVESVLMSLPPLAAWDAAAETNLGPLGEKMSRLLVPRDWAAWRGTRAL